MPRRHKPIKHTPFRPTTDTPNKKRYPSKLAAERIAEQQMLLHPGLELKVYQGDDKGWYLTRNSTHFH